MKYELDVTTSKFSKGTNSKKYIMLHHTGWVTSLANMTNYLAKNSAQVSAHYVVAKDWGVARIGTDDYILWHAGTWSKIAWVVNTMNNHSIWIEVISDGTNFTDAEVTATWELVKYLSELHNIPTTNIIRHKDYSTRKWDIWDNFYKTAWFDSFSKWKDSIFKKKIAWDYRKLAWKSPFRDTETAWKTLQAGTPDEALAVVETMINVKMK